MKTQCVLTAVVKQNKQKQLLRLAAVAPLHQGDMAGQR